MVCASCRPHILCYCNASESCAFSKCTLWMVQQATQGHLINSLWNLATVKAPVLPVLEAYAPLRFHNSHDNQCSKRNEFVELEAVCHGWALEIRLSLGSPWFLPHGNQTEVCHVHHRLPAGSGQWQWSDSPWDFLESAGGPLRPFLG